MGKENSLDLDLLDQDDQELHGTLRDLQGTGQELQVLSDSYHRFMGLRDKSGWERFFSSLVFHLRTKVKQQDFLDYLLKMVSKLVEQLRVSLKKLNDLGVSRYDELEELKSEWDKNRDQYGLEELREMCVAFVGERKLSEELGWILAGEEEITTEEDRERKAKEIKRQIDNLFEIESALISLMMSVGIIGLDSLLFNAIQLHALGRISPLVMVCTDALNDMGAATDASLVARQATSDYLGTIFKAANLAVDITEEVQRMSLTSPEFAEEAKNKALELRKKLIELYGKDGEPRSRLAGVRQLMVTSGEAEPATKKEADEASEVTEE